MRLRLGLVAGFAAGVYVTTVAQQRSRQLSQQVNQKVNRSARRNAIDAVTEKAKAVVDLGVGRARDVVTSKIGDPSLLGSLAQAPSRLAAHERNGGQTP
jgi:precorrin-2 methylase